jgi:inorganic pyrophosphatase
MPAEYHSWRPHPWHGLSVGPNPPSELTAFIEITPFDLVKFEVDKTPGSLRVDRSQTTSSLPPALYGFVPQTYAGHRVAALMEGAERGDQDPLDICVLCERPVTRSEVIMRANVVGGISMNDHGEADDKIIAVFPDDPVYGSYQELVELPEALVNRLVHYFATYKLKPGAQGGVKVAGTYDRTHAERVVMAAMKDYRERFELSPDPES